MSYIPQDSLLNRISNGEEEAFTELYTDTKKETYRLIYFLASNKGETEDIMSDVYLALYKSLASYNKTQPFQAWFNGLIVRQVRCYKRKSWRVMRLFQKIQQHTGESEAVKDIGLEQLVEASEMFHHINHLSSKYKEVIVLRYYKQLSYEEIADIVNVPLGTIKSRHHYALKQLRQYYTHSDIRREHVSYEYGN